jgi:SAM-dependent methyltransferase
MSFSDEIDHETGSESDDESDDEPGTDSDDGIRNAYARHVGGADGYYREFGATYRNPHELIVQLLVARLCEETIGLPEGSGRILDLACGSGEVTLALINKGIDRQRITSCDPYTSEAFTARTGMHCESWSFAGIANGIFDEQSAGKTHSDDGFAFTICSYALHLCEPSWLPVVAQALARASQKLAIITPHKRPIIDSSWGWTLHDEFRDPGSGVRLRTYESTIR